MTTPLHIDGRQGEGGGQILRSSLSLSAATGRPIVLEHIRAGRKKPGLMRQHLTCVRAAAAVCGAEVEGAQLRSTAIRFTPGAVQAGDYRFAVGSAGSCLLVLQTVLPPLLRANGESTLTLEGGTHNPMAPPFDALEHGFVPQLRRLGAEVSLELVRPGFFPAGGGEVRVRVAPLAGAAPLELLERGPLVERRGVVQIAQLSEEIAQRQTRLLATSLPQLGERVEVRRFDNSRGPGNAVSVHLEHRHVTEVATAFGMRDLPSKRVVARLVKHVRRYLAREAPVGEFLADQLMLPLALTAGGVYRTLTPSLHATTNAAVINAFLGEDTVELEERGREDWLVRVRAHPV